LSVADQNILRQIAPRLDLSGHVGARENVRHARQPTGSFRVDPDDAGVCIRASQNSRVEHPRQPKVVDESRGPREQREVLTTQDGPAYVALVIAAVERLFVLAHHVRWEIAASIRRRSVSLPLIFTLPAIDSIAAVVSS
jgi:hypothetical protein